MLLSETISDPIFQIVPWVVFFPAIGVILNLLFGKHLGERGSGILATLAAALSFAVSLVLAISLAGHPEAVNVPFAEWITLSDFSVGWNFRVDTLSLTMMLVVSGVGTLIHLYAIEYMHADVRHNGDESRYPRFFVFFNLFITAMMILVSAGNYLMLFVGWEGVGLCSYLLIGFWYDKGKDGIANAQAGKKAFVTNRIGDFGLLLAMFIMFFFFGSLDFDTVFGMAAQNVVAPAAITAITLCMILGVMGKSAQLPLYIWLPDAMAGPTPVSALIHAATMVTAGVYLVARSAPLYTMAPLSQSAVAWVGALTAIFAAGIALTQFDIKKVLAYSTISQLGFMVAAVGMGAFTAGMFHLVTHAFFKALLFLSAGSVIQGIERGMHHGEHHHGADMDPQDMRNMGGLQKRMPVTFVVYLMGALALAGIAPLAGFFSKDEILLASKDTTAIYIILSAAAFLTAFYMGRQILMVFFGKARTEATEHASESKPLVTTPLVVLAILAVTGGALNFPGVHTLDHWLEHSIEGSMELHFSWSVALISVGLALAAIFLAWMLYGKRQTRATDPDALQSKIPVLFNGLSRKWWLEDVYAWLITGPYGKNPFGSFAGFMADSLDAGFVDRISTTLGSLTGKLSQGLRKVQNGFVHSYALSILLGVVLILVFIISH